MLNFIIVFCLLGYCLTLVRYADWAVEDTPFFVIASCIVLAYCAALAGVLKPVVDGLLVIGGLLFLWSLLQMYQQRQQLFKKYLTPGFVLFLVLMLVFGILAYHLTLSHFDVFSDWATHAKLVYINNGLISARDATIHKSYPLGGALFYYWFYQLSGYSEGTSFVAQLLLMLGPMTILFKGVKWQRWQVLVVAAALLLFGLSLFRVEIGVSGTLYMDSVVGIFFGMSIVAYLLSAKTKAAIFKLIPMVIALSLFKLYLLGFILGIFAVIAVDQMYMFLSNGRAQKIAGKLLAVISLPVVGVLTVWSWHYHVSFINAPDEFRIRAGLSQIIKTLIHPVTQAHQTTMHNFHHAVRHPLTIGVIFFLLALFAVVLGDKDKRRGLLLRHVVLLVGFCCYLLSLLVMYLYSFNGVEALRLASFNRYVDIYLVGWFLVVFGDWLVVWVNGYAQYFKRLEPLGVALVLLLSIGYGTYISVHHYKVNHSISSRAALRRTLAKIAKQVNARTPAKSSIYILWQAGTGLKQEMLFYDLVPRNPNTHCPSIGKKYYPGDIWTCPLTTQQFSARYKHFQYVLLAFVDKQFWQQYGSLFPQSPTKAQPLVTYKICMLDKAHTINAHGCHLQTMHAYLYKVVNQQGRVKLVNVMKART